MSLWRMTLKEVLTFSQEPDQRSNWYQFVRPELFAHNNDEKKMDLWQQAITLVSKPEDRINSDLFLKPGFFLAHNKWKRSNKLEGLELKSPSTDTYSDSEGEEDEEQVFYSLVPLKQPVFSTKRGKKSTFKKS